MPLPPDICNDTDTRIMFSVLRGNRTVRGIAKDTGLAVSTTYDHLRWLRTVGLVTWEQDRHATILPAYVPVEWL